MTLLNESLSVRALFEFRDNLELGDGMFKEITGVDAKDLMAFRRGRLKEKPIITARAAERIEQCNKAFGLALEFCGDQDRALDWFYADAPSFGGKSPIDLTLTLGGLEKIQAFIDSLRKAVAAASVTNEAQISAPAASVSPMPATAEPQFEKPVQSNIADRAEAKKTKTAATRATVPISPVSSAIPATGVSPPSASGYVPGGMARSRAQAFVPPPPASVTPTPAVGSPTLNQPIPASTTPSVAPPVNSEPAPRNKSTRAATPLQSVNGTAAKSEPTQAGVTRRELAAPPQGVDPEKRIFLLKEPFTRLREKKPDLTLKEISAAMLKRGCLRFAVQTHASRLVKSYTWATWTEVVNLAEILDIDPYELGRVRSE